MQNLAREGKAMLDMTPFLLSPAIKDYIWGGTRLREEFGKVSDLERLAESWELSCHPDGESIIASGEYKGMTLAGFLKEHPEAGGAPEEFPVLVKLIDARNDLSVQVHPDDSYARVHENDNGKTEMWYVIDAEEDAHLVYGFRDKLSKEEFRKAVEENTLMEYVNRVPVKKGDVFFITPGTLHAIGKGILIAEIQQSSNVTYRVYDYGRLGADGKPRELHVDKAIEVTDTEPRAMYVPGEAVQEGDAVRQLLAECRYFRVTKYDISGSAEIADCGIRKGFSHILVIDGQGDVEWQGGSLPLKKGSSVFVPAGMDPFIIKGRCSIIYTAV